VRVAHEIAAKLGERFLLGRLWPTSSLRRDGQARLGFAAKFLRSSCGEGCRWRMSPEY
jgi:hypothetical protein